MKYSYLQPTLKPGPATLNYLPLSKNMNAKYLLSRKCAMCVRI